MSLETEDPDLVFCVASHDTELQGAIGALMSLTGLTKFPFFL